jgi:hypothetical protein
MKIYFQNECSGGEGCEIKSKRCYGTVPVTDDKNLSGFWLQKPDGTFSAPFYYMQSVIKKSMSLGSSHDDVLVE